MKLRWALALALAIAPATARAQTAPVTTVAWNQSVTAEQRVGQLATARTTLQGTYDSELRAIDRLKQQRASWRRDRELRDQLSTANETARQLAVATRDLTAAQAQLAAAHRTLVTAIDAELAAGTTPARSAQLAGVKTKLALPNRAVRRIVLAETAIDPLADPEELDQQAAALRESEAELQRQVLSLDSQEKQLEHVAELRKEHDRTIEMDRRDDNQTRRTTGHSGGESATVGDASGPRGSDPTPAQSPTGTTLGGGGTFESEARVALADVVDATTIDTLARAQRSGDPAQRAAAARATRDAVAARLQMLKTKRLEVEARAKSLRR